MQEGSLRTVVRFLLWVVAILAMILLDVVTGPRIRFPVLLLVPVAIAASRHGRKWALSLAVLLPLPRLFYPWVWNIPWDAVDMIANTTIRIGIFVFIAVLVAKVTEQRRVLEKEVEVLRGILPICMFCKKIRSNGEWVQLEWFISRHSEAEFSHGMCQDCASEHYPELFSKQGSPTEQAPPQHPAPATEGRQGAANPAGAGIRAEAANPGEVQGSATRRSRG